MLAPSRKNPPCTRRSRGGEKLSTGAETTGLMISVAKRSRTLCTARGIATENALLSHRSRRPKISRQAKIQCAASADCRVGSFRAALAYVGYCSRYREKIRLALGTLATAKISKQNGNAIGLP